MVDLSDLWLPILLSSVALFFASFLAWTVLPHHKRDWLRLPDQEKFSGAIRGLASPPGNYCFPHARDNQEMGSPEFQEKMKQGPAGTIQIWGGAPSMGKNLVFQFLFFLNVSFYLAYLATLGPKIDADFMTVFRFVGTAGILAYSVASVPSAIWFKTKLHGYLLDGIAYGLITGAIFAACWPKGPSL